MYQIFCPAGASQWISQKSSDLDLELSFPWKLWGDWGSFPLLMFWIATKQKETRYHCHRNDDSPFQNMFPRIETVLEV